MTDREPSPTGLAPAEAFRLSDLVAYAPAAIVSRTLARAAGGSATLFAVDAGQALSEHTAPFDALVCVLDGTATLTIGGKVVTASTGEVVLMPANVPHALEAPGRFKMLLFMLRS
jgi:quercetin dioxygenase-like cupin family protein